MLCATAAVIVAGLLLRVYGYRIGLPFFCVKYGGSLLWGAMVYGLVASALSKIRPWPVAAASFALAVAVELSRLIHTPALDAFRLTLAGALLLGRIFSPWNILAYGLGIAAALIIDHILLLKRKSTDSQAADGKVGHS
ncbi:ribosomal maturation YjgA family protein [Allorhizobium taibaishanense]|uniref:DUF2809 domain-containing protein n=1 Tax=Allorhizobium taibaishanense TaxID=887144 RepID=A0A1Q9A0Q5_9HYPH|nr:DUF2809 domain-containing protein [Allorhizobium taibaishanense]MBB4007722.1 hypothetical protein [Allorhizobium taibaishanense]OLP48076.1 hypothetical protein BJF91_07920 [Allorhizobium taibaishanense]